MDRASANSRKLLQALGTLDRALTGARAAVLAVHPELSPPQLGGGIGPPNPGPLKLDAASWMGDEALAYMAALSEAIARYAVTLGGQRSPLHRRRPAA